MWCNDIKGKLPLHLQERLSPSERWEVALHLSNCDDCRREYIEMVKLKDMLEERLMNLGTPPEDDLLVPILLKNVSRVFVDNLVNSLLHQALRFAYLK